MVAVGNLETTLGGGHEAFPDTVWSSLLGREGPATPERVAAMEDLARAYWRPVYKFIRTAGGASIEDAKDLTQEFFSYLLEGSVLAKYEPAKGRFRTFLKGVLRNFLSVERRDASRLKRGGGRAFVPLDIAALETPQFLAERDRLSPEEAFDRQWASEILSESLAELRRQFTAEKREIHLRAYEAYHEIGGAEGRPTYAALARELGLTEQQVKDHLAVARERLEKIVRERLARRVASPGEVGAEFNDLLFG